MLMMRYILSVVAISLLFSCGDALSEESFTKAPKIESKQESKSPIKNQQNSSQSKKHPPSAQSAVSNGSNPQENSSHGGEEGTEFWPSFLGFKFKVTDSLLVIFTFILALFTGLLWCSTHKLWGVTKDTLEHARQEFISTHRPKIIIRTPVVDITQESSNKYPIRFTYINIGESPAHIVKIGTVIIAGANPWNYGDLPPSFSASVNLVKSVFRKENGLEEAIYRRTDHRIPEGG